MRDIILSLTVLLLFSCDRQPEGYTINGTTTGILDSTMLFLALENEDFDSTFVINNAFSFQGKVEGDFSNMWLHTRDFKEYRSLWVVNAEITFDATNSSFRKAKVTGSRIQDQSTEYENHIAVVSDKMDSIHALAREASDSVRGELRKGYEALEDQRKELEADFIRNHPDYELSAFFLTFLKNGIDKSVTRELFEGLDDKAKNSEWGQAIALHIDKSVKLSIGDEAIDFALPGLDGEMVSLSDFKGKHVLLEFWSTGCGPCRWENPNLLKAYRKYGANGFEILGVTLDEKATHWESTVEKDSIEWTTVGDLKGMLGEVPITYSIEYIPKSYLLDENGIVVAEDLRGEMLQEKLKEIFGG